MPSPEAPKGPYHARWLRRKATSPSLEVSSHQFNPPLVSHCPPNQSEHNASHRPRRRLTPLPTRPAQRPHRLAPSSSLYRPCGGASDDGTSTIHVFCLPKRGRTRSAGRAASWNARQTAAGICLLLRYAVLRSCAEVVTHAWPSWKASSQLIHVIFFRMPGFTSLSF